MYISHVNAHARSIHELTGDNPARGRSMYIENQINRTGIIDDTLLNSGRRRNPLKQRPVTIHFSNLPQDVMSMSGNYASGWQQPRDQHAVGQQVVYSAGQKMQQQSYQQRSQPHPSGRRPIGRYGQRPSSDSLELLGGGGAVAYKPGGNRAANMFKKAKEHTDKYAVDDEAITPQAQRKARAGAPDYEPPLSTGRPQQAKPTSRPASRPVSRPAAQPASPQAPYTSNYGAPQQAPRQAPAQRQAQQSRPQSRPQQAQRQPQPAQPQSPYATEYNKPAQTRPVNPPQPKGPQYSVQARQASSKPSSANIGCTWNDSPTKIFHGNVQPYEEDYNRKAQGWQASYKDTFADYDDSYDAFAPKTSPNYHTAPKLDLTRTASTKQKTMYTNKNQRAKGWKTVGIEDQDAEGLYNPHRPSMSTLSSAFEESRPKYGGQPQRPAAQQQRSMPQQQRAPQQRPPQQRMSSAPNYAAGTGSWGGMLESDDL